MSTQPQIGSICQLEYFSQNKLISKEASVTDSKASDQMSGRRKSMAVAAVTGILLVASFAGSNGCHFPALYNFGDSNSDTGSVSAIYGPIPPPNGVTFFHRPAGRWSDGRLIIDFIAEKLRLPYLSGYLDSIGTSFRYGANFAISGATIELSIINGRLISAGFNQISLTNELGQFEQFKNRTTALYDHREKTSRGRINLPRPQDFSKALYTMDIGQNDIYYRLTTMGVEQALASVPDLVQNSSVALVRLYKAGARTFWIHNTGPIGCLPILVGMFNKTLQTDQVGCIKPFNEVAQEFNKQLKDKVSQLRTQLPDTAFTYVDIYSARYSMIKNPKQFGFVDPLGQCTHNGTSCSNPSEYISWDGIHFTEAANRWVAKLTLNGSLCDPPLPITKACLKHFS